MQMSSFCLDCFQPGCVPPTLVYGEARERCIMYCSMPEVEGWQEDELLAMTPETGISKPAEMQCVVDVPPTLASTSGVRGSHTGFGKTLVLLPCI